MYHNRTLSMLKNFGFDPKNILDIGCNKGEWTAAAKRIFPSSVFYLFDGENQNIETNDNTIFQNLILSDEVKEVTWYKIDKSCGNSYYLENTEEFSNKCKSEKKKTDTLNNIFKPQDIKFDLLKIDTQGSELDVLNGFSDHIENTKVIIMELPFLGTYNIGSPDFYDYINFMKKMNFIPFDLCEIHNIGFINQIDIAFIRKDDDIVKKAQHHLKVWNKKN